MVASEFRTMDCGADVALSIGGGSRVRLLQRANASARLTSPPLADGRPTRLDPAQDHGPLTRSPIQPGNALEDHFWTGSRTVRAACIGGRVTWSPPVSLRLYTFVGGFFPANHRGLQGIDPEESG